MNKDGYGRLNLGRGSAEGVCLAPRIVMYLESGHWPPSDRFVLHRCDNRRCCNPAHLRLGTRKENTGDMLERRRGRGSWSKPTMNEVSAHWMREIGKYRPNLFVLGRWFGVPRATARRVMRGETWSGPCRCPICTKLRLAGKPVVHGLT